MHTYGLIGKSLSHSFSKRFFTEKFQREGLAKTHGYELFELEEILLFPELIKRTFTISGLNVTIPYKQEVIPFLDILTERAERIGAVNTIAFTREGKLIGENTDYIGFRNSLPKGVKGDGIKALVCGTGGASKAVLTVLKDENIPFLQVSRMSKPHEDIISYDELTPAMASEYTFWINTTPLGMHPHTESHPKLPYEIVNENFFFYDLVYNPEKTQFMSAGEKQGATTQNGLAMLHGQALAAWDFWQKYHPTLA